MIGRIIWFSALAGIAVVTAALQLDRQSEKSPALAPLVPHSFRNYAQTQIVAGAVESDNAQVALVEAQRLVRQRPIPAEYLSLLAIAQTKAGQVDEAGFTIQIAGRRGWREPVAQETVLRLALTANDKAEAARRYTALFLRKSTPDALLQEVGPAVLDQTGGPGQQTMIDIVSRAERWHSLFLRRGVLVMPAAAFAEIAAESIERGARFDCEALERSVTALARENAPAAERLQTGATQICSAPAP